MADLPPKPDDASAALERRLATILACDVAGYSRMMGENEEATVQTLRGHRAVFDSLLKQHHGRIFNTAGDAILAEFPSAVEAVRCATEIQSALRTRNEHLPPEQRMVFRMGINLGDVVVQEGDLLGDGVNVAARLQTLADPGGICISGSVYDQIRNKLSLQFKALGDKNLKNIGTPVRTFTITQDENGATLSPVVDRQRISPMMLGIGAVIAAVAVAGYAWYRSNESRRLEQETLATQLAVEKKATEEARRLAEEEGRRAKQAEEKAERERVAAETAKRESALQAQAQSADEARRRAEAERKRLTDENQRLAAEKEASEAALKAQMQAAAEAQKRAESTRKARMLASAADAKSSQAGAKTTAAVASIDGSYDGQLCNFPSDPNKKACWRVPLTFENGKGTGSWASRATGKTSYIRVSVAPDGQVSASLEGWKMVDGSPLAGSLSGRLVDAQLDLQGRWANGLRIDGHWTHSR